MLIGVLGAGERERPLLLRLSEHSKYITISQNSRIAYLLPVEYFSLNPKTHSGLWVSHAGTAYVSLFMLSFYSSKHVQSTSI